MAERVLISQPSTIGTGSYVGDGFVRGNLRPADYTGKATGLRMELSGGADSTMKYALYESDGTLMGSAEEGVTTGTVVTLPFTTALDVTLGSNYYSASIAPTDVLKRYNCADIDGYYYIAQSYTAALPTDFSSSSQTGTGNAMAIDIMGYIPPTATNVDGGTTVDASGTGLVLNGLDLLDSGGNAQLDFSDTSDFSGTVVTQTFNSQTDTTLNFDVVQGALSAGTIYARVTTGLGQYNATALTLTLTSSSAVCEGFTIEITATGETAANSTGDAETEETTAFGETYDSTCASETEQLTATGESYAVSEGDAQTEEITASGEAVAAGETIIIDHTTVNTDDDEIPQTWLDAIADQTVGAGLDVAFGHQSVGNNILDGLQDLNDLGTVYNVLMQSGSSWPTPTIAWYAANNGIGDFPVDDNTFPLDKIADFDQWMRPGGTNGEELASAIDLGIMKLCFVDITDTTDYTAVWNAYRTMMEGLIADYPSVTWVWTTSPVTDDGAGLENQSLYNALVRNYIDANGGMLFDIADIESHEPDGTPVTFGGYEALYSGYTSDGGHLDDVGNVGRQRMARAYWWMMSRAIGWDGTIASDGTVGDCQMIEMTATGETSTDSVGDALTEQITATGETYISACDSLTEQLTADGETAADSAGDAETEQVTAFGETGDSTCESETEQTTAFGEAILTTVGDAYMEQMTALGETASNSTGDALLEQVTAFGEAENSTQSLWTISVDNISETLTVSNFRGQ